MYVIYIRYSFQNVSDTFMNNTIWNHAVLEIIDALEHKMSVNKKFDRLYETLIKSILSEMDAHLDIRDVSKSSVKKHKNSKPYWNKQLDIAWKNMTESEKKFRKFNGHRNIKGKLKTLFHNNRSNFE